MAAKQQLQPEQQTELAATETPAADGFDGVDLLFGFPLAVSLAHFNLAAAAVTLSVFVAQKSLRLAKFRPLWQVVDFALALLPGGDDDPEAKRLPGPVAQLVDAARGAVAERAGRVEEMAEEADWSEGGAAAPAQPAQSSQVAPSTTWEWITIDQLAAADNLLIVGNRGSGKTTLLQAILQARTRPLYIYDPHNAPAKWPSTARVIGGGSEYPDIYQHLIKSTGLLVRRSKEMNESGRTQFPPLSLVSDEWGSVVDEIEAFIADLPRPKVAKDEPAPGKLSPPGRMVLRLLKEGRKFHISFIASAHGDTNASLGCDGDNKAFRNSFDWFIYCGAFVKDHAPDLNPPMGRNPQGGTFPLIVVALSPTTGEKRLLDMRGIDRQTVNTGATVHLVPVRSSALPSRADEGLLMGLLGTLPSGREHVTSDSGSSPRDSGVTAAESGVTSSDIVKDVAVTPAEVALIARSLSLGMTPSQAAKAMKGCNSRTYKALLAKVEFVKRLLDEVPSKDQSAPAEPTGDDDADPDVGPFGPMLGK